MIKSQANEASKKQAYIQVYAHCADEYKVSGAHLTFNLPEEGELLGDLGFLRRTGIQYHWANNSYGTFDDFLMDLKQSKRNNIRKVVPLLLEAVSALTSKIYAIS